MHIPDTFRKRLHRDFQGRFRIRWSHKRNEFHIEQKIATGMLLEPPKNPDGTWDKYGDDYIRASDGYGYVMSICQGDRKRCEGCGNDVKLPIRETKECVCVCGRRHRAFYYPLDDLLLLHLRWLDPLSGGVERARRKMEDANRRRELSAERHAFGELESATLENFNNLFDIQSVGYTGKVYDEKSK